MSHVIHIQEWCHTHEADPTHHALCAIEQSRSMRNTYEWVMAHVWMGHVTRTNESCHAHESYRTHITLWVIKRVMARAWMGHGTHMNDKSCHNYSWVVSHVWMSHTTHMNESCRRHKRIDTIRCIQNMKTMQNVKTMKIIQAIQTDTVSWPVKCHAVFVCCLGKILSRRHRGGRAIVF